MPETIAAVSTPPGRGGIGIVRVSGPRAFHIASMLFRPLHGEGASAQAPPAGVSSRAARGRGMRHGLLVDPADGLVVDDVLLLQMPAPQTYTGEDIVEFQCHGSPRVLATALRLCIQRGARAAGPGEFTLRAFRNGRIDLTQAEAVMNLIAAETEAGAKLAAAQAQGALGRALAAIAGKLVALGASLEAGIDFPDDEVPAPPANDIRACLVGIREDLDRLAGGAAAGRLLSGGAIVTIAGPPNAGKSSLFNALLGQERAIVTESPGTTRDVVEARADWQGIPVTLRDTAGLRRTDDPVESIGVRLAQQALREADIVLLVYDVTAGGGCHLAGPDMSGGPPAIVAANKIDLCCTPPTATKLATELGLGEPTQVIYTSAATGEGIDDLRAAILSQLTGGSGVRREATLLTTARQEREVHNALRHVAGAIRAVDLGVPPDVFLVELYAAMGALAAARGSELADVREDVVREVFARFCVGK